MDLALPLADLRPREPSSNETADLHPILIEVRPHPRPK